MAAIRGAYSCINGEGKTCIQLKIRQLHRKKTGFYRECKLGRGTFARLCVYPLNDDYVIAGVKMAREIRMLLVVCVCILIQGNVAADKCVVLQKKC